MSDDLTPKRRIGYWTCTALVIGNIIGMGIFVLPASLAPYGFNGLIGWAVVLVGSLLLASVVSQLARALPNRAGLFGYIEDALGKLVAYLASWAYWVSLWLTYTALITGVITYLEASLPAARAIPPAALALGLLWAAVGVNLLGVRAGGEVQIVTTLLKLLPLAAIIALGAWLLVTAPSAYTADLPTTPITAGSVAATATLALFAMMGVESAGVPAARVEDPKRTVPRATMTGAVVTVVIYVLVCTVPMLLIPQHQLAATGAPFSLLMDRFAMDGAARWLGMFVIISGLGALNGWVLLGGELTRTMADGGVLPRLFGRTNRFGAPQNGLLVTAACSSLAIVTSYSKSLVTAFTLLVRVVTGAVLPFYLCCAVALAVLWYRKSPGCHTPRALTTATLCAACMVLAFVGLGANATILTLLLVAAGVPVYAYTRWRARKRKADAAGSKP